MKKLIGLLTIVVVLSSCGSETVTKEEQLKALLEEQAELNQKIRTLKDEMLKDDNTSLPLVVATSLEKTTFRHFIEVQARVDGDESVNVSPRLQGTVTSILVNEGDRVSKGQVLATLDDQIIRQNQAEVNTQYEFANNMYLKQKNLWEQKIGSEVQYLTAKNNKEALERRLASVNEQLDMTRIKSPINGTVDGVNIKIGQSVMPGMTAMSVVNLSNLKVKGEVGESHAGKVQKGDEVILYFPDLKQEVSTKVGYASRVINTLNRTFAVEVPLPSGSMQYSPNMVVVLKIVDYKSADTRVVQVDVVQKSRDGEFVMVVEKAGQKLVAKRKVVKTGRTYNGQTEILEGIADNDKVITVGYRDLNDGEEVRM